MGIRRSLGSLGGWTGNLNEEEWASTCQQRRNRAGDAPAAGCGIQYLVTEHEI
jgi:hypothetical protein